jgi:hypothetical protein
MSATQTPLTVVVADDDRHTDDTDSFADALIQGDPSAVEQLIARVLGRAHRMAERYDGPTEARTILQMAHSFADELAAADPEFDRVRFIHAVADSPS